MERLPGTSPPAHEDSPLLRDVNRRTPLFRGVGEGGGSLNEPGPLPEPRPEPPRSHSGGPPCASPSGAVRSHPEATLGPSWRHSGALPPNACTDTSGLMFALMLVVIRVLAFVMILVLVLVLVPVLVLILAFVLVLVTATYIGTCTRRCTETSTGTFTCTFT